MQPTQRPNGRLYHIGSIGVKVCATACQIKSEPSKSATTASDRFAGATVVSAFSAFSHLPPLAGWLAGCWLGSRVLLNEWSSNESPCSLSIRQHPLSINKTGKDGESASPRGLAVQTEITGEIAAGRRIGEMKAVGKGVWRVVLGGSTVPGLGQRGGVGGVGVIGGVGDDGVGDEEICEEGHGNGGEVADKAVWRRCSAIWR
jgi:hypothetical protein